MIRCLLVCVFLFPFALKADAPEAVQLRVQGNAHYAAKDYGKALALYQAALAMDAADQGALRGEANSLYLLGRKPEALDAYRQLAKAQPLDTALARFIEKLQAELAPPPVALPPLPAPPAPAHGDWLAPLWRSALCPGWGQAYNNEPTKAWLLGGTTWGLLGGVAVTYILGTQAQASYADSKNSREAQDRYDTAYQWYIGNQVFYVLFGTAYVYNLFDAPLNADKQVKVTLAPMRDGGGMLLAEAKW
jgi:tetratricopeptide (TPR) repeat protein